MTEPRCRPTIRSNGSPRCYACSTRATCSSTRCTASCDARPSPTSRGGTCSARIRCSPRRWRGPVRGATCRRSWPAAAGGTRGARSSRGGWAYRPGTPPSRPHCSAAERYHAANAAKGKLFARERVARLVDEGSFVEDAMLANALADGLPADGVITGIATVDGRPVCLMANDSTVKAGSWGARTVEKIIRIIERAYTTGVPMIYLVDSAGARITDQVDLFPGRRGAGRIFWNQVRASGSIPQACALFGPSAAGGAYIP